MADGGKWRNNLIEKVHIFGGAWTDQKLGILQRYLADYTKALSKQRFRKVYIDAFAGTGARESSAKAKQKENERLQSESEFKQTELLASVDPTEPDAESVLSFLDGSARVALKCRPSFDQYIFIEKSPSRCRKLEQLKIDFPLAARNIFIEQADANKAIQDMCRKSWGNQRAVLFLDPYGAQVRWATIEAIAGTQAIDLWVLFPLGGVNRMLTQSGEIPPMWRLRLNELFGDEDWAKEFYKLDENPTLFDDPVQRVLKAETRVISDYFLKRLRSCFPYVASQPAVLYNSKNSPLFLFCFAAGNPGTGGQIALRIASHILNMGM